MKSFKAYRIHNDNNQIKGRLETCNIENLTPGEVVIRALYSSINFKDALGITGKGKIYKRLPIIGGIDVAGVVESSTDKFFKPGDNVLGNGCGIGESHDGGYSEIVRIPSQWVIKLPTNLSLKEAMIFGTAGFTAAICIHRMEENGQNPDKGPIVITGATGGVGSFAIAMLSKLGYQTIAVTGKPHYKDYLLSLGATEVSTPEALQLGSRPLEKARFGGAIDNIGGELLAGLTRHMTLWGNIASVGLASSPELYTTVMPFILRGVSILGISSGNCPMPLRIKLWDRLATDLKPIQLDSILKGVVTLDQLEDVSAKMIDRKTIGRYVVECK